MFLHQLPDVQELFEVVAKEKGFLPAIVEKDYWLMHLLWGLKQQGFDFALKGGTSLSKGFDIIHRFSEDVDIRIEPEVGDQVKMGKEHNKPAHIQSRKTFFEKLLKKFSVTGFHFARDSSFDDLKMRSAGIRAHYISRFNQIDSLKEGVLLEVGFDQVSPSLSCIITSWAYEKASELKLDIFDNRAKDVACYCPEYTFVEKLQAISTKYRNQQTTNSLPANFIRHYYDVYQLLGDERVLDFIGTPAYFEHKEHRFRNADEKDLQQNPAFTLSDKNTRALYENEYRKKSALYFERQPDFQEILDRLSAYLAQL